MLYVNSHLQMERRGKPSWVGVLRKVSLGHRVKGPHCPGRALIGSLPEVG